MNDGFRVSDYESDPEYLAFFAHCDCGVLRTAPRYFHNTTDCRCEHHDVSHCRPCAVEVLARHQLDELLPELVRRLTAEAEHGPFLNL